MDEKELQDLEESEPISDEVEVTPIEHDIEAI